jgi:hypothetical protein
MLPAAAKWRPELYTGLAMRFVCGGRRLRLPLPLTRPAALQSVLAEPSTRRSGGSPWLGCSPTALEDPGAKSGSPVFGALSLGQAAPLLGPRLPTSGYRMRPLCGWGTDGGTALTPSDQCAISFCSLHHPEQHRIGEPAFEKRHGLNLRAIAEEFVRRSRTLEGFLPRETLVASAPFKPPLLRKAGSGR